MVYKKEKGHNNSYKNLCDISLLRKSIISFQIMNEPKYLQKFLCHMTKRSKNKRFLLSIAMKENVIIGIKTNFL